jgi:hypothetical protein
LLHVLPSGFVRIWHVGFRGRPPPWRTRSAVATSALRRFVVGAAFGSHSLRYAKATGADLDLSAVRRGLWF